FTTSGPEGIELLQKGRVLSPESQVILITAWASIPLAVEAMRLGAFDFIAKPWDNHDLLKRIATAISLSGNSERSADNVFDRVGIIGQDPQLLEILRTVERVAPTEASVLITGENGTGKEMIAHAVHANSARRSGPMVKVNLGGISQSLFESEMFGHKKGAFTGAVSDRKGRFELADKGTIFLDEIGDLDLTCQVKMLRVLQEHTFEPLGQSRPRHVDIRIVSATNADLPSMVADGRFREDLFYRINLITLHLPALRERSSDIPLLVRHFSRELKLGYIPEFSAEAMTLMSRLPWYGNIRELRNMVERLAIVSGDRIIEPADIERNISPEAKSAKNIVPASIEDMERQAVERALNNAGGNVSRAAATLGISRQALYRRMEKFGL
ncbi:MAG: sigma-54 dependent transcriptional regulator, partial [Muribaculum sp.]|nr:sigma-54 dependent transcriptional regulator [Muribaculum sp.]